MKREKTYKNRWQEYHRFLEEEKATELRKKIVHVLGCSESSFWRRLRDPEGMSIAEKTAIASVYELPLGFLFPECTPTKA